MRLGLRLGLGVGVELGVGVGLGLRLGLGVGVGLGVARLHREDEVVVVEGAADVGELHRRLDLVRC